MFSFTDIQVKGKDYEMTLQCHEELITISFHSLHSCPLPGNTGAISPLLLSPLFQVVSLGLYFGDQAYLRSSWNILDGFLVFVSLIDIVVSVASAGGAKILGVLRVLRLLRTLRPLRSEPHRALLTPLFPLVIPRRGPRVRSSCARQSVVFNKQLVTRRSPLAVWL